MTVPLLLVAFVLIVGGAIVFTNAIEWLGHRLALGEGAVGALLAAVGTALPESVIPLVAVLAGGGAATQDIAIGSIIGAPFLLGTVAMLLIAITASVYAGRRAQGPRIDAHGPTARRDLPCFLALFPVGVLLGALHVPLGVRIVGAAGLVIAYGLYVRATLRDSGEAEDEDDLQPLFFDASKEDPPSKAQIALQLVLSLAAIVGGAELFVHEVESIALTLGVSTLVLSLVLAPLATELPEKANSVLWVRKGKDSLALGNVSGAMVFQSTLPVAFGMVATSWRLDAYAIAAAGLGLAGGALALWALGRRRFGVGPSLAWAALFLAFVVRRYGMNRGPCR
jgi:cation:H+ antiporter